MALQVQRGLARPPVPLVVRPLVVVQKQRRHAGSWGTPGTPQVEGRPKCGLPTSRSLAGVPAASRLEK